MRKRPVHWNVLTVAVFVSLANACPQLLRASGVNGNLDLLKRVAVENQANRERIRTWRGRAFVNEAPPKFGRPTLPQVRTVDFVCDYVSGTKFWLWRSGRVSGPPNGEDVADKSSPDSRTLPRGMLIDGALYVSTDLPATNRQRTEMFQIRPAAEASFGPRTIAFDPMYFLTESGDDVAERFLGLEKLAKTEPKIKMTVSEQGTRVIVQLGEGRAMTEYVADLAHGGNLTAITIANSGVAQHEMIEHMQVDGIWVPHRYVLTREDEKHAPLVHTEIEWIENVLNGPLPADQFTLASLGAQKGDLISDLRSRTMYNFGVDETGVNATAPAGRTSVLRLVIIANGVFVALLVIAIVWKRAYVRMWRR